MTTKIRLHRTSDGDYTFGPYRIQPRYLTSSCRTTNGWTIVDTRGGPNALVGRIVARRSTLADVREHLAHLVAKDT